MCLAVPMVLTTRQDSDGVVERGGVTQRVSLLLLPEAVVGDHVLVHAGYAISRLNPEEAAETERLLAELAAADEPSP